VVEFGAVMVGGAVLAGRGVSDFTVAAVGIICSSFSLSSISSERFLLVLIFSDPIKGA